MRGGAQASEVCAHGTGVQVWEEVWALPPCLLPPLPLPCSQPRGALSFPVAAFRRPAMAVKKQHSSVGRFGTLEPLHVGFSLASASGSSVLVATLPRPLSATSSSASC